MKQLKERWGIKSNKQFVIILIVFAVTGTLASKLGKPLTLLLGITEDFWLFWLVRILIVLPIYKVILLLLGCSVGEFDFFWKFVKKMLIKFGLKKLLSS